jgi:hypothetical protein
LAVGAVGLAAACSSSPKSPTFEPGRPPPRTPPPDAVGGFSIEAPAMTLQPGEERTPCWIFPLVVDGPSRIVGGATLSVGHGMHHGNVVTRLKDGDGVRVCPADIAQGGSEATDVINGGAVLFASSTQVSGEEWQSYPKGMGYRVGDGVEIVARLHYLNASLQPVTVAPRYQWYTIAESALKQELAPFAWEYYPFQIPPHTELTVHGDCDMPAPMHIVTVLPHMHKLGTAFTAAFRGGPLDGKKWLDSPGYDPESGVLVQYDPAIDLSQGSGASFACTWFNTFDKFVEFGYGDNEMCILFGYGYPPMNTFSAIANGDGNCLTAAPKQ